MDDLIPFLIVIAISIIGAAARKKRKRDAVENITPPSQNRKSDEIFSWLEKLTAEEEQVIPYREPSEQKQNPVNLTELTENKTTIEPYKKQVSQYPGFSSPKEKQELVGKEGTRTFNTPMNNNEQSKLLNKKNKIKPNFNLRKAIIYYEILKRKYN